MSKVRARYVCDFRLIDIGPYIEINEAIRFAYLLLLLAGSGCHRDSSLRGSLHSSLPWHHTWRLIGWHHVLPFTAVGETSRNECGYSKIIMITPIMMMHTVIYNTIFTLHPSLLTFYFLLLACVGVDRCRNSGKWHMMRNSLKLISILHNSSHQFLLSVSNYWTLQIFFSLGPGFGTLLALSSYNKFHNDCYRQVSLLWLHFRYRL